MIVRKEWSAAEAMEAQRAFQEAGGTLADPTGPVSQWAALHDLDMLQQQFQRGDRGALLAAIAECARTGLVMPDWLVRGYLDAWRSVIHYKKKSWDDAFGRPHKKGAQLPALRKERRWGPAVWNEVKRRSVQGPHGRPIDDELFAEVGKQLGLGLTLTKKYYAAWKRKTSVIPPTVKALLDPFVVKSEAAPPKRRRSTSRRSRN